MSRTMYEDDFNNFKLYFPEIAKQTVNWHPSGRSEITVKLDDGSKVIFNSQFNTIRNIKWTDEEMPEDVWRREFATRLYNVMYHKGFNQSDLAELSGISRITIGKYVNGSATPTIFNLTKIARVLECSINELTEF